MSDGERYADVIFPEYYEDIFSEDDLDFRFRLIRTHIHPKLRILLAGCLDMVAATLETDPLTFSKMGREPRTHDGDADRLRCALYGLRPNEVRGNGFPNLSSSSGRGRHVADFDLSFFADHDGLGLELHVGRLEELDLSPRPTIRSAARLFAAAAFAGYEAFIFSPKPLYIGDSAYLFSK